MRTHVQNNRSPAGPDVALAIARSALLLAASLLAALTGSTSAQSFTTLYNFSTASGFNGFPTNRDGAGPGGPLILSSNILYGTAVGGGDSGFGTLFTVGTDGTGFVTLYSFDGDTDGTEPQGALILESNTLYGTALRGGSSPFFSWSRGSGTIFSIQTDGSGFINNYTFADWSQENADGYGINDDGVWPNGGLVLSNNTLYGTTFAGSSSGYGTVFSVDTDGTGFSTLFAFDGTNGSYPHAGLAMSDTAVYGTALGLTLYEHDEVFTVSLDGTAFGILHRFSTTHNGRNSDGANPQAGLVLSSNSLYGTAAYGGSSGNGTIFKVNTDGTGFTTLHTFTASYTNADGIYTNTDGANPQAGLILSGNTLYGTAYGGGSSGNGTVFAVNIDGTSFTALHNFSVGTYNGNDSSAVWTNSDGAHPQSGLLLSGNLLYGTASYGGSGGSGTIFSISLPTNRPQLTMRALQHNVLVTWPTNASGFSLQSTTNLASPALWTPVSPAPVIVNGQNTVTNPISVAQQFYRLAQ